MKKRYLLIILFFLLTNSALSGNLVTGNGEGLSDAVINGYVKDRNNNSIVNIDVYLIDLNTSEILLTSSLNSGFYSFDLSKSIGFQVGDILYLTALSYEKDKDSYYFDSYYLTLNSISDVYWYNLTLNRTRIPPQVIRSMPSEVYPGSNFTVYIEARYYGGATVIWETLPKEFKYIGCNLSEENQAEYISTNHTVRFILYDENLLSYNLTAPNYSGNYSFSGSFIDFDKIAHNVSGNTKLNVTLVHLEVSLNGNLTVEKYNVEYFNAEVYGGMQPFTFKWDFDGDGIFDKTGQNVSYIFNETGLYNITVKVIDANKNSAENTYYILCQDTMLALPITTPPDKGVTNKSEIMLQYSEYVTINNATLDGKEISFSSSDNKNFIAKLDLNDGLHLIKVIAVDGIGNTNLAYINFTFDSTKPVIEIKNSKNIRSIDKKTDILVNAYDYQTSIDNVEFKLFRGNDLVDKYIDSTGPDFSWPLDPLNYEEGNYVLEIVANDLAGNYNNTSTDINIKHTSYLMIFAILFMIAIVAILIIYILLKKNRGF